jgi:perosamine synthetase
MATFFAVHYQGATPIPIDCESDTWNMNPEILESKITPKTKAIIVVHIYGHPVNMGPVMEIAKKYNLFVVEDAAEAHGAEYNGKRVGSIGDIGCFSFYANKIITTGEGGMVTMNNKELADSARMYKSLSFGTTYKFMHRAMGYNYRLTNLQAALGVAQMRKIDAIIERKREIAAFYLGAFKDLEHIALPVEKEYAKNVYWMFNIILKGPLKGKRSEFIKKLADREIESREDFVPYNEQEIFIKDGFAKGKEECPVAHEFSWDGLYIPSGVSITQAELDYVAESFKAVYNDLIKN